MARRGSRVRRSTSEFSLRIALAVVVAFVGYGSVARTLAQTLRTGDLARAHHLAPGDGRITALFASSVMTTDPGPASAQRAAQLARAALQQDPTTVPALSTLGLYAQTHGDAAAARGLFRYAEMLSRRDLQVQLWAIENAVARGDIANALTHYDIALRTSRSAWDLLVPVLGTAIADRPVRVALTRTLAANPVWGSHFINYVVGEGTDPRTAAQLLGDMHRAHVPVSRPAQAALVNKLATNGLIAEAWSYYALVHTRADRNASRDPDFGGDRVAPSLLDCMPVEYADIVTDIRTDGCNGV